VLDGVMELDINRIKVMHDEVLRINRLVDDLSKLARYESKDFHLVKEDFDVSRLIKGIINNFENDFAKQNKTITFDGEKQIINADKDKINQVFVNMISNALKFTKPCGKLEINVKDYKHHTKVVFKDDGIGIAEEDLPNVFERFYRVDKSRSRHTGGAGIGLAIAKTVILAHGGDIQVKSELGAGTEFIITIPKAVLN
jgi:signal transduction histidine kinase